MSDEQEPQEAPRSAAPETVEREKFARVVAAKRGLEQQLAELREQNQALEERVSSVDALTAQIEELQGKLAGAEQRFSRYQTISSAVGTTDTDVIELFEWQHSRLGDDRPPLTDWLGELKKSPDAAPSVLRGFLAAPKAEEPAPAPRANGRRPSPSAGHVQPPGAPSAFSRDEMAALRAEALATGDWSKLAAANDLLMGKT